MTELAENIVEIQENKQVDDERKIEVKDPYGFIYITTNLVNGMRYLGQKAFNQGWETYLGSGRAFKKALKDYGRENFKRDIILVCYSDEELNQKEYELSVFFDVVESDDWYNLVLGGGTSRGWHPSEETKRKIGDAAKARLADPTNHPCYGKPGLSGEKNSQYGVSPKERMDEETYKRWYEKHKPYWENQPNKGKHIWEDKPHPKLGTTLTQEAKDNLSQKAKERLADPTNHPMYGKDQTDVAKTKMRNAHKRRNIKNGITVYSPEINMIFYGSVEAAEKLGVDQSGVTACCKGKKKHCGTNPYTGEKLTWMYAVNAVRCGYLTQESYDTYVNNVIKEIDTYGKSEKRK